MTGSSGALSSDANRKWLEPFEMEYAGAGERVGGSISNEGYIKEDRFYTMKSSFQPSLKAGRHQFGQESSICLKHTGFSMPAKKDDHRQGQIKICSIVGSIR